MNIPYTMKKCSACGEWKVAFTVNFYKKKGGRYGLNSKCKECERKRQKQWYKSNRNKKLEYDKQWQQANRNRKTENNKRYYKANRNSILDQQKQYRQSPEGQVATFNGQQRRRIKEEQQGDGITKDQWLEMMSFFDWRCAYSGERLTKDNRSKDHIVPLNAGGDNTVWNLVPMTRSLNSSKHTNNMEEWYKEQECYDPSRLQKIYDWQEYAYNKWGKDSEYFNTNDIQIKLI